MRVIRLPGFDGPLHLAMEEILLSQSKEDIFLLWQNDHTAVIGKNQNTWAEIDTAAAQREGITVVRRLSGGGAVYHDRGNINFSFITAPRSEVDFAPFLDPIIEALRALGVMAHRDGRNDILVGEKKISGNAQCTYRCPDGTSRLLHHGTLLLSCDLTRLTAILRPRPEKLQAKGIASVRSRVVNLRDLPEFPSDMDADTLMNHLIRYAAPEGILSPLRETERTAAEALADAKYRTWEWNWGASAPHETEYTARFPFGTLTAAYSVREGRITSLSLWGDFFGTAPAERLEAALTGIPVRRDALLHALRSAPDPVSAYMAGATADQIASLILGEIS